MCSHQTGEHLSQIVTCTFSRNLQHVQKEFVSSCEVYMHLSTAIMEKALKLGRIRGICDIQTPGLAPLDTPSPEVPRMAPPLKALHAVESLHIIY